MWGKGQGITDTDISMKILIFFIAVLFASCTCKCNKASIHTDSISYVDSVVDPIPNPILDTTTWEDLSQDSFIVHYRQKIHGYKVKAVLKPNYYDVMVLAADVYFTKRGKTFMLHSDDFGDTIFCKGRDDFNFENPKILEKYRHKTVKADYKVIREDGIPYPKYTPFFFQDMDFDGIAELIIVQQSNASRYRDCYNVYRIVEGKPFLIDYPPYYVRQCVGSGMSNYPEFDFKKKTITCPIPEGEIRYDCYDIYGISKKKDVIVVNGHKHYFNKIIKKATQQVGKLY